MLGPRRRRPGGLCPGNRPFRRWRRPVRRSGVQRLVANGRGDEAGSKHRRDLGAEADAADSRAAARSTSEERGERGRERHGAEMLEGGPLRTLAALEGRAVLALAEVSSERSAFGARKLPPLEAGESRPRFVAGEAAFELFAESSPGAEHQGLDCGDRDVEHVGDLGVRAAFELAHDECGALVEG